jgi:hypothetical protein
MAVNQNEIAIQQLRRVVESMGWKVKTTSEEAGQVVVEVTRPKAPDAD